ncbi:MAG: cyclase family protein [Magnetococcales bacterium]|nr:cyclase family protein [Magnetococcales bacterium]MBF0150853.1 cyclase family protein [Magnetococcales bacterium]MBF0173848.1 cyclase family protein [Magnetococcales bacterium]MBF0347014.1 cyclase family protein [Magnetococcales bacterium]MBF0631334.1 cyclase family protein [Magnetococcales bacterium]
MPPPAPWILLSHPFGQLVPVYGDACARPERRVIKSLRNGDTSNVFRITLENHWGTHVDAPAHFFDHGQKVTDFAADEWIFTSPCLVEIPATPGMLIGIDAMRNVDESCDLVLLRTGFQRFRGEEVYSHDNPGVHAEVGLWLRRHRPRVRALGMDFVSLTARRNRPAGRESHRAFLDPEAPGRPILLIEDMNLDHPLSTLSQVIVAPLLMQEIDSAPCTIFGRLATES